MLENNIYLRSFFVGSSWKFLFIASKNCDLPFTHFVNKDKTKQKLSFKF